MELSWILSANSHLEWLVPSNLHTGLELTEHSYARNATIPPVRYARSIWYPRLHFPQAATFEEACCEDYTEEHGQPRKLPWVIQKLMVVELLERNPPSSQLS